MPTKDPEQSSVIGPGLRVTGDLKTQEPLRIEGLLEGNLEVDGTVEIAGEGRVRGDIAARNAVVEGRVEGNVTVADRFELRVTGRVRGDIVAPRVAMAEGSFFRGRLRTARAGRT